MNRIDGRTNQKIARAAITLAALAWLFPAAAQAGDGLPRLSSLLGRKPAESSAVKLDSPMNWWSVPRPARVAAKKLAKSKDASITRCVAIEREDKVDYEVHASHHLGLFKRDDFVLTSVSEPKATAEKKREEQTLRRRMERLRDGAKSAFTGTAAKDGDRGANPPGSTAFPVK